ncbi:MAG: hypothetical protein JRI26_12795 [Deltaproteobacteria bacterium]|nr:hypothetical protein [Deltaproteobacteria bacterium]
MDNEMFSMVLDTLKKIEREKLTIETKLEMDKHGDFPEELIRFMLGPDVALHLIFVPSKYGGLGASASQIAYNFISGNLPGYGPNKGSRNRGTERYIHPANSR